MVKLIAFFKRKTGISVEQFQQHWRTTHAGLVVRQRGLRRYVQNHTLASGYRRSEPSYDGVAEAWFDDTHAMRELGSTDEYRAVREDEANFIDATNMGMVITDEVVIRRWNASCRTRVFVLDQKGVIAGKDLTRKQLDALLVRLQ